MSSPTGDKWDGGTGDTCAEASSMSCSLCALSMSVLLSARHLMLLPGKDVYKQLIMINNELSKSSLGLAEITTPQQEWARSVEKTKDGVAL